ncbi:MAG: ATP-binding cassette domain-containing protein [Desulfosarcinaceae bacterium]|nr:ATP-binding cassette domain-containing protein [Desulfosarcinaceae bacterium]
MTGLRCHQLRYRRPDSSAGDAADVLSGIDARFKPGTLSLVSGPTGAGKSTLLHLLAGLLRPTAGEVQWLGQTVSRWHSSHKDRWRRQVGIVFQHQRLLGDLTAGENVLLPLIPRRMPIRAQYTAVADALGRVDLATKAASPAARLSGGERQRLSLARAIAPRPALLLADEPSAFQDDAQTAGLLQVLMAEKQRGAVVIVCSHDPRLRRADGIDHRHRLHQGRLVTME